MPTYGNSICRKCRYHPGGRLALPPVGRAHRPLAIEQRGSSTLLVARAPGINEWMDGRPLISANLRSAAHRVEKSFGRIGKRREDFDITNAVLCYPGKRPQKPNGEPPRDKSPDRIARVQCRHWLQETINSGGYNKVVTFGKEAEAAVRACTLPPGVTLVALPHPSSGRLTNADLDAALS